MRSSQSSPRSKPASSQITGLLADAAKSLVITQSSQWSIRTHAQQMAELMDNEYEHIVFQTEDMGEFVKTLTYFLRNEPYPWPGKRLFLINTVDLSEMEDDAKWYDKIDYHDLVIVKSSLNGWYQMKRVGKVICQRIRMCSGDSAIQGILY